jgi:DNA segregation ATPase FtsK/SpoIIIE, S-DNA-T family
MSALSDFAKAPEGFSLRRLALQATGLALLVAAVLLALALATYERADPSWNHAVDQPVGNALGYFGACLSDGLLQGLGLGAWLVPVVLLDWAVRLLLARGLARLWLRLVVLPPMLVAAALALAIFPAPSFWPLAGGLGGALGGLAATALDAANLAPPITAMAAAALVALLLLYVMPRSRARSGRSAPASSRAWPRAYPPGASMPARSTRWRRSGASRCWRALP